VDEICFESGLSVMRDQRLEALALVVMGTAALCILYIFNPSTSVLYMPCPFHELTGLECPGCGSLRALHHLLHGHVATAFTLNPLMVLVSPFLGYSFLSYLMDTSGRRLLPPIFVPSIGIWIFLGVVLFFWVIRNTPVYPF
jgi:hypothetical protein